MRAYFVVILGFTIPIVVALKDGSTYAFALSLIGAGVVFYFVNVGLITAYLHRRAPNSLARGRWEETAGTGLVPKWVSEIGLLATGLAPSGIVVALLIFLGVVDKR